MKVPPEKSEPLREILRAKVSQLGVCPLCGVNQWAVGDQVFELLPYGRGGGRGGVTLLGGPVYPVLPVTCGNCGNALLLNAFVLGLLDVDSGDWKI